MTLQEVHEEYNHALRQGQKEYKELVAADKDPYPAVLDDILETIPDCYEIEIGLVEIPAALIVGTKSAGRVSAFTASFRPLLKIDSEFARKWIALCQSHLSDEGIRDPILCYEYLGKFYVQEGNKRVSVLRHFGAPRIPGMVIRVVPPVSTDPKIIAYHEFLEFYKAAGLYDVQFRRPGDYAKLLSHLGKKPGEPWTLQEKKTFTAYFHYFREAFHSQKQPVTDTTPAEALLLWLQLYPFQDLGKLSGTELKTTLAQLWEDVASASQPSAVKTEPEKAKSGILERIMAPSTDHVNVAFIHQLDIAASAWVLSHEEGRKYLEQTLPDQVTVRSYFNANTSELAEELLEKAIDEGAQVVFTTAPNLSRVTLKMAVKHPKVRFLNCSVNTHFSSIRSYYGRMYEAKFITGAIAGAMAQENRIGYISSSPIFGEVASINAFALGAQLTNPRAEIDLRWSCVEGSPQADFFRDGIRVVSNRVAPSENRMYLDFCSYGTYLMDDRGTLIPLATPLWVWGKFYEHVVRAVLAGTRKDEQADGRAVNYWWGMDSGVIGIQLSDKLPEGVRTLAKLLRRGLNSGSIDPFFRKVISQNGTVKNDGSRTFTPDELLTMDWLCSNVVGDIPGYEELLPMARPLVRELGIYRDTIPQGGAL